MHAELLGTALYAYGDELSLPQISYHKTYLWYLLLEGQVIFIFLARLFDEFDSYFQAYSKHTQIMRAVSRKR